ncbi:hypothetical protein D3C72_2025090 [compost metagenome]
MATRQHDLARLVHRSGMQVDQQVGVVLDDHRRHRLGNTGRGAGNNHRVFHIQQASNIGAGLVDQILDFKVMIQAVIHGVNHLLAWRRNAENGHATGSIDHLL